MLKQQQPKRPSVKFPPIATKAGDCNGFEPNRRALSSAKNSDSRAMDLEKQLFSKLQDYDAQVRKEKRLQRMEGRRKTKESEPVAKNEVKREVKRSSTSHISKTLKDSELLQANDQPVPPLSKTSTEIQSTPLISNKQNHTFITNTRAEELQPTEEELRKYGEVPLEANCPFTDEQMNQLYREYEENDCYISYTSSKEMKQLNRMLTHCDESLDDLVKDTQRMMRQVGFCLDEEEPGDTKPSDSN